jgi:hypothetical protein
MRARARGRRIGAVAISAAAHAVILAAIALHTPMLIAPPQDSGPPVPIIPVLLTPRTPPSPSGRKPAPIRLHRRPQRFTAPLPIAPLPVPETPGSAPAKPGPVALHPAPLPEGPKADIRASLRKSPVGCANADAVGLTRAERALCDEALGKGAKTAAFLGLGLARDKQADFDAAAARKEADRRAREAPAVAGSEPMRGSIAPYQAPRDPFTPPPLPRLPP